MDRNISDLDYEILTPGRRTSKQLCHINMMKRYNDRNYCCVRNEVVETAVVVESEHN